MLTDASFAFGLPAITNSNTAVVSPNVFDAGLATKLFTGPPGKVKLFYRANVTGVGAADGSINISLVGADNAALSSNPIVISSTGVVTTLEDGTAIGTGGVVVGALDLSGQTVAKRYYGLMVTLGGTTPDLVGTVLAPTVDNAYVVFDAQTHQINVRAAVPA